MEKIKLFVVQEDRSNMAPIVFSSAEKANLFIRRFPDMGNESFQIIECEIDPEFITIPDMSPYFARFEADGSLVVLVASPSCDEFAISERSGAFKGGSLEIYFLAENRLAAINKAHEMREQLLQYGKELILKRGA